MEQKGFDVKVTPVDVAIVFESLANGDADATVAAWLPYTHKDFYEQYEDDFTDLGPNLEDAKIGLVVPDYMDIESIEDLESKSKDKAIKKSFTINSVDEITSTIF